VGHCMPKRVAGRERQVGLKPLSVHERAPRSNHARQTDQQHGPADLSPWRATRRRASHARKAEARAPGELDAILTQLARERDLALRERLEQLGFARWDRLQEAGWKGISELRELEVFLAEEAPSCHSTIHSIPRESFLSLVHERCARLSQSLAARIFESFAAFQCYRAGVTLHDPNELDVRELIVACKLCVGVLRPAHQRLACDLFEPFQPEGLAKDDLYMLLSVGVSSRQLLFEVEQVVDKLWRRALGAPPHPRPPSSIAAALLVPPEVDRGGAKFYKRFKPQRQGTRRSRESENSPSLM